jgi:hypothetical protein
VAKSHDLDEPILGQPPSLFDHVIEHHCDLSDRPTDVHKAQKEKIEKYLPPRRHLMMRVAVVFLGVIHRGRRKA